MEFHDNENGGSKSNRQNESDGDDREAQNQNQPQPGQVGTQPDASESHVMLSNQGEEDEQAQAQEFEEDQAMRDQFGNVGDDEEEDETEEEELYATLPTSAFQTVRGAIKSPTGTLDKIEYLDLDNLEQFVARIDSSTIYAPVEYDQDDGQIRPDMHIRSIFDAGSTHAAVNAQERLFGRPHVYIINRKGKKSIEEQEAAMALNYFDIPPIPRKHPLFDGEYYAPVIIETAYGQLMFAEDPCASLAWLEELVRLLNLPEYENVLVILPIFRNPKAFTDCGIGIRHFGDDKRKKQRWFNPENFRNCLRRLVNLMLKQHWNFHTKKFEICHGGVDAQAEAFKWENLRQERIRSNYVPVCAWNTDRVDMPDHMVDETKLFADKHIWDASTKLFILVGYFACRWIAADKTRVAGGALDTQDKTFPPMLPNTFAE